MLNLKNKEMKNTIETIKHLADQYSDNNPDHNVVITISINDGKSLTGSVITRNADVFKATEMTDKTMKNFIRDVFKTIFKGGGATNNTFRVLSKRSKSFYQKNNINL